GNESSGAPPAGSRNDNVIIGAGRSGPRGMILIQNFLYHTPAADDGANELGYPLTPAGGDVTAIGNYFIGGSEAVDLTRWDAVSFQGNTIYAARQHETSLTWSDSQSPSRYSYDANQYF